MEGGYAGQILRVDLSSASTKTETLDPELTHQFIGGRGLGARILWDMLEAGADPIMDRIACVLTCLTR